MKKFLFAHVFPLPFSRSPFARSRSILLALLIAAFAVLASVEAQENSALIDVLVRKGVLTNREAEEVRAEVSRESKQTSAGKIQLSNSISELKLYGDLRLRYQYDSKDPQLDPLSVGVHQSGNDKDRSPSGSQQSRWRFRLRLNADFKLGKEWFGGVELQTNAASDSGMQTFENGFADYPIFISKAFLGWAPAEWVTVTAGKVSNPFYTTDLVWDPDINPTGITETLLFHKLFAPAGAGNGGFSKDGKSLAGDTPVERPWELTLVAGQFIFDDNLEGGGKDPGLTDNDTTTDAYLFETQLIGSYKFGKTTKLTIAPAWFTYINGSLAGVDNGNPFNDNTVVSGATRNLNLLLLPGDLSFTIAGQKAKLLWDFSYNIEGRKRVEDIYHLVSLRSVAPGRRSDPDDFDKRHSNRDNFAWLIGVQFGENKKARDWSILANYRETGLGAVDPNLNESDFAQGELNTRGLRISAAYNFTDFLVGAVSYGYAWNLRDNLVGGEATGGNAVADSNEIHVFQLDLALKF